MLYNRIFPLFFFLDQSSLPKRSPSIVEKTNNYSYKKALIRYSTTVKMVSQQDIGHAWSAKVTMVVLLLSVTLTFSQGGPVRDLPDMPYGGSEEELEEDYYYREREIPG